jgi:hypothetical protein
MECWLAGTPLVAVLRDEKRRGIRNCVPDSDSASSATWTSSWKVAAHQGIAMVVLRPYNPATDDGRRLSTLAANLPLRFTSLTDVKLQPLPRPTTPPWNISGFRNG